MLLVTVELFVDKYLWQLYGKLVQTMWCELKFLLENQECYKDSYESLRH